MIDTPIQTAMISIIGMRNILEMNKPPKTFEYCIRCDKDITHSSETDVHTCTPSITNLKKQPNYCSVNFSTSFHNNIAKLLSGNVFFKVVDKNLFVDLGKPNAE